jgi:hypothetical protein
MASWFFPESTTADGERFAAGYAHQNEADRPLQIMWDALAGLVTGTSSEPEQKEPGRMAAGCQCAYDASCRTPAPAGEACQDHQADALVAKLAKSSSLTPRN